MLGKITSHCQPRRPGADDSNFAFCFPDEGSSIDTHLRVEIGDKALQLADPDATVPLIQYTGSLTLLFMGADSAANCRKVAAFGDYIACLADITPGQSLNESGYLIFNRATRPALWLGTIKATFCFGDGFPDSKAFVDLIEEADGFAIGSPTINGDGVKPVWDLLSSLTAIGVAGKLGAAFGSYGWSGEAVEMIEHRLRGLKFRVPIPGLKVKLTPTETELESCRGLGRQLADALLAESATAIAH